MRIWLLVGDLGKRLIVTVLLNNYFGRQFNSLNDIVVHPTNKDIYFTDSLYGYLQDFRPAPGIQNQVYRFNPETGAVTVAADGFALPNGKPNCYILPQIIAKFL